MAKLLIGKINSAVVFFFKTLTFRVNKH